MADIDWIDIAYWSEVTRPTVLCERRPYRSMFSLIWQVPALEAIAQTNKCVNSGRVG